MGAVKTPKNYTAAALESKPSLRKTFPALPFSYVLPLAAGSTTQCRRDGEVAEKAFRVQFICMGIKNCFISV